MNFIFGAMLGVPLVIIGLIALIGDDLRYWPVSWPVSLAPFAGLGLMLLGAVILWLGWREHSTKHRASVGGNWLE